MANTKLVWLKRTLVVKVVLSFLFWGLPDLLYPLSVLQRLGVPVPEDSIYLRLLGAVIVAFGVAYWYAWKDPFHNTAILKAGVVDNGLTTLVTLYFIIFEHLRSIFLLISAPLTFLFFIAFLLLMPKKEAGEK